MIINKLDRVTSRSAPVIHVTLSQDDFSRVVNTVDGLTGALRQAMLDNPNARVIMSFDTGPVLFSEAKKDRATTRGLLFR